MHEEAKPAGATPTQNSLPRSAATPLVAEGEGAQAPSPGSAWRKVQVRRTDRLRQDHHASIEIAPGDTLVIGSQFELVSVELVDQQGLLESEYIEIPLHHMPAMLEALVKASRAAAVDLSAPDGLAYADARLSGLLESGAEKRSGS
jgi:hypothetical protein